LHARVTEPELTPEEAVISDTENPHRVCEFLDPVRPQPVPLVGAEAARPWIVALAVIVYGYAAVGNAIVTRGRHVGGFLMGVVVALALLGL